MKWNMISMGDIALRKGGSVDPKKHQEEVFELYSIPAFDAGAPEVVAGSTIGSSKKAVQPNDVMISRIVPHIRRACVVRPASRHRQIASGEWIIFRDERIWPKYLRWLLVGDVFHSAFMRTVSGVGGSLLRARPAEVFKIQIPLPPLPEQRRIAEILDKADALRAKRRAAIAQLHTFTRSIFLDMFGDPATNPKGWPVRTIRDLLESASYGTSEKAEATGEFPVLRMNNITRTGEMVFAELKYMPLKADQRDRYLVRTGDVLFNRTNSAELVGKTAIYREANPMAYAGYLIRLRVNRKYEPEYLAAFLNTMYAKRVLRSMCKSIIGMANINATELQALRIPVPTHPVQHEFAGCITAVEKLKATHRVSLVEQDDLFTTLQQRAFRGDL